MKFLLVLLVSFCIQQKEADPKLIVPLLGINNNSNSLSYSISENWTGCMMSFQKSNIKYSFCFEVPIQECNKSLIINIDSSQTLQKRKDDLSFLALNYPSCTGFSTTLLNLYNSLSTPTSTYIHRLTAYTGSIQESDLIISFRESCSYSSIKVSYPVGLQRYFTLSEFSNQNSVQAELGWVTGTTQACLKDLSMEQSTIDLSFSVRSGTILPGAACSLVEGASVPYCGW